MKTAKKIICISLITFIIVIFIVSTILYYRFTYSTLHLSPELCGNCLNGISPSDFCETKGKGTWLENKYLFAKIDEDGCLIITLKNNVISDWKNTFTTLQILQSVLGEDRDIGITIDYSLDFMDYMKDAYTCGFEISDDFTKVIDSPEDNSWYYPFILPACAQMQMLSGKTCQEITVEYIEIDGEGEIISTIIYPEERQNDANVE